MAEKMARVRDEIEGPIRPPIWGNSDNFSREDSHVNIEFTPAPSYKRTPTKTYIPHYDNINSSDDAESEDARQEALIDRMIGQTYAITYYDAEDNETDREITINDIYHNGRIGYIDAYCHLREDDREFRLSRISGYLYNVRTGEMIDPAELK